MADTKITALTAISTVDPAIDVLPIVDVSDTTMAASGTTKKITSNQILGAGGTATLASATITGDLTVDTSTLKVDSANNRVGIGTATPIAGSRLDVRSAIGTGTDIQSLAVIDTSPLAINNGGGLSMGYVFEAPSTVIGRAGYIKTIKENATDGNYASAMVFGVAANGVATAERYRIGSDGTSTWSVGGSTAMTLNSTGLGVGTTTTTNGRVNVQAGTAATGNSLFLQNLDGTYNAYLQIQHSSSGVKLYTNSSYGGDAGNLTIGCGGATNALIVNGSGNVGVGVTPSAWNSSVPAIQVKGVSGIYGAGSSEFGMTQNNFYNASGQWIYGTTAAAGRYSISAGVHAWYTATSGTINTEITQFASAKMTLDASGNLVLGSAAVATTATDGFLYVTGCAGTPTGTPTAKTGRVPIVVDTTNNKLYFYSGGSWVAAN